MGLFARLVDAGFNASLLLRGTVPGGTAAAAEIKYAHAQADAPRYVYYARVIRQGGWVVLHYLYFYWMNDWRSSFHGANDHEADLEQVFVVLEDGPAPRPVWFGGATHDDSGDQLRRRWDDPGLHKVGDHPVVHAGAGSHAAHVEPGEYFTTVPLPTLRPVRAALGAIRVLWRDVLRQADPGDLSARLETALSIPFIDYARGDGLVIGRGAVPPGTRSRSATRRPGSTATAVSGASTPATGSAASVHLPARGTRGRGPSGSPGTIRSASWASRRSRRRGGMRPCWRPASRP